MRRQGNPGTHGIAGRIFRQRDHYIVALDRARLRIYRENRRPEPFKPGLELVESIDFPEAYAQLAGPAADAAGRFPGSATRARTAGMSMDERLPMQREYERRRANDLASELDVFLSNRPEATWDLAASPTICRAVLARLSPGTQKRLRRSVLKDVVKQPVAELAQRSVA